VCVMCVCVCVCVCVVCACVCETVVSATVSSWQYFGPNVSGTTTASYWNAPLQRNVIKTRSGNLTQLYQTHTNHHFTLIGHIFKHSSTSECAAALHWVIESAVLHFRLQYHTTCTLPGWLGPLQWTGS